MSTKVSDTQATIIELRQQAHYWRALHARAVEREAAWKEKAHRLEQVLRKQERLISELTRENEDLKLRVAWLEKQVFGQKSEQTKPSEDEASDGAQDDAEPCEASEASAGKRGKKPGQKGYGRKPRTGLPTEEVPHELPESERRCPLCGLPYEDFPGTEDSEEIHWEVRIVRRVHKRARYRPTCNCGAVPGIVTAPAPPKLIPKGLFSTGFWVQLIMEKFLFQRPLYRVRKVLELNGLFVSQGTLTGGLKRLGGLIQPLYAKILERNRAADHWHMDETRWFVFAELEGKTGYRWWLWVVVTRDTCVYLLDPSRSAEAPKNHLGEDAEGIISADRYSVYKSLGEDIRVAFCWSHVRRDFLEVTGGNGTVRSWADAWVTRINGLFRQNRKRLEVLSDSDAFEVEDRALREAVASMEEVREEELADEKLKPVQRKILESLQNHWKGLMLFVEHPEIPMDNNEAERRLRNPVVGRKNYYGNGSVWSGVLTAMLFTLCQTLLLNDLDPQKFLLAYFDACAENGGQVPADLEAFLPWNLSDKQKADWRRPSKPP